MTNLFQLAARRLTTRYTRFLSTAAETSDKGNSLTSAAQKELSDIRDAGTYKNERIITSPQSSCITVDDTSLASQDVLNFCANNYLGLSNHPSLLNAAKEALTTHGFGLSSVRFICGTQDKHKELEAAISKFHGTEDTILFPSCFDANAGVFEALLDNRDAVISDALNHASLIDGIRLCKAHRYRFAHGDMAELEEILKKTQDSMRIKLIVTDGVFSMDGDVAKLNEICELADVYGAQILVDDCHATGFFGKSGRGSSEHCRVEGRIDIITSTLGKALGGATGGYITASKPIVDLLRQRARPYLFSNSVAPAVVGASLTVLKILDSSSEMIEKLHKNTNMFRAQMKAAGFTLSGDESHAIVPVMIGDARLASEFADAMLNRGIYVVGFSYPVVPKGQARIRVQLSAAHTHAQVQRAIDAFIDVGKEKGLI
mmetsp:Transcript_6165/g.9050  ORF Transcript_6165/g.9050 Transcript_6165/m.9050 type:complete len:430 (+) Transcript_6165:3333-4622(+)